MVKTVAIIMCNRLEALGVSHILSAHFDATSAFFSTLGDVPEEQREKFKLYITSESEFLKNLSFFMPHNDQSVIVSVTLSDERYNVVSPIDDEAVIASKLEGFFHQEVEDCSQNRLTQREVMVLRLVVEGLINKEIADRLNISVNTVLTHRKNITAKLGIKSVSGLSVYAIMNGIVVPKQ